ncbi:flavin monoamine oxidase family protein [Allonocardiopsis opalescens]|uniref:Monoamine oxidase n=1 Tax=Allonocardiopsis opalescens TaxID=1144618 RepID=A0A2T0PY38_9ACTN|nr:NAD(P)/FAD-dependent oxidoreductase [Allonocardiopsis opalescens]PRX96326.1 monoamine oxidase [Allonocardiopsis opalescens]
MDVVVIGAGFAGLAAARELRRSGVDVTVLEAAERVGGRALTVRSAGGSAVDLGGMWIGPDHTRMARLAADHGVSTFPTPTRGKPVLLDRGRVTRSLPARIVAGVALLRLLKRAPQDDRTTVADWLKGIPHRRARSLLEVIVTGSLAADVDEVSLHAFTTGVHTSGGLRSMLGVEGGAQESLLTAGAGGLAERMAAGLDVRLARPVTAITRTPDHVVVDTPGGPIRADHAIVAVPPPVAADIRHTPPLPADRAALERGTFMGTVYKAIAVYDTPFWRAAGLSGEVTAIDSPVPAITDVSPPGGPGHLAVLVPGRRARALAAMTPGERRSAVLHAAARALGPAAHHPVEWHEKAWHEDPHVRGGYSALPRVGALAAFTAPPVPAGRVHWAGTETARTWTGYLEGAVESGLRAAGEVPV